MPLLVVDSAASMAHYSIKAKEVYKGMSLNSSGTAFERRLRALPRAYDLAHIVKCKINKILGVFAHTPQKLDRPQTASQVL